MLDSSRTGSGYIIAAQMQVVWVQCLGRKVDQMVVVAHTLPFGSLADGLLGMDFLRRVSCQNSPARRGYRHPVAANEGDGERRGQTGIGRNSAPLPVLPDANWPSSLRLPVLEALS